MTTSTTPESSTTEKALAVKGKSLWQEAMGRLMRNRAAVTGGIIIIIMIFTAIFADLIAPFAFDKQSLLNANAVPTWVTNVFPPLKAYGVINDEYPIGADKLGRDLFSRIVYGTRVSLAVAFIGPVISLIIGVIYGSISGFFGGRLDNFMMRVVDVLYAFPGLLFIILLMAFFRTTLAQPDEGTFAYYVGELDSKFGGLLFIMIGIGLTGWETQARLTRGQVLSVREKEYIEAARSIGASNLRIMFRHILPNILGPLIVLETLSIPGYIYTEAFLSFIGLGVNPPTPSWGSMIAEGSRALRAYPNQALFPALALAVTMFAFNFLGDGLRDALEPRLRGTQDYNVPYIEVNGANIYYNAYGDISTPHAPVLLIHGSTIDSHTDWDSVAPELAKEFLVFAPDCRGHGRSNNPNMSYSFKELADDAAAFIRAMGYEKAHIIGHSNGGNVALVTLMQHPEVVQTCIPQAANAYVTRYLIEREPKVFDPERVAREAPAWRDEMIALHGEVNGPEYWKDMLWLTMKEIISEPDYAPFELARVERPTLVIMGADDTVNAPDEHAQYIANNIPGAELWIPEKTGHNVHLERSEEWIAKVLDFLKR